MSQDDGESFKKRQLIHVSDGRSEEPAPGHSTVDLVPNIKKAERCKQFTSMFRNPNISLSEACNVKTFRLSIK